MVDCYSAEIKCFSNAVNAYPYVLPYNMHMGTIFLHHKRNPLLSCPRVKQFCECSSSILLIFIIPHVKIIDSGWSRTMDYSACFPHSFNM